MNMMKKGDVFSFVTSCYQVALAGPDFSAEMSCPIFQSAKQERKKRKRL
jgi:hypothetical protein